MQNLPTWSSPRCRKKQIRWPKRCATVLTIGERAKLIRDFSAAANAKINEYLDDPSYNSARAEEDIAAIILNAVQSDIYAQFDKSL